MTPAVRIVTGEDAGVVVVALAGDVEFTRITEFTGALRDAVDNGTQALIIDLDGVDFLDSRALEMLFRLEADLGQRRQRLAVVLRPEAPTRRALDLCDARSVLNLVPTLEDALTLVARDA